MNFNISELKTEFINKQYSMTVEELPNRETTFLDDKITLFLSSKKTTLGFKIFGKLRATIGYKCVRCLKDIIMMTELPIKFKFDKEKNSFSEYINNTISNNVIEKKFKINNMIADMIELAKPNNPLCRKDCKGLCSRCGIQLNHESCKCNRININNPFDKLKFL
jgi:uncharacterized protein